MSAFRFFMNDYAQCFFPFFFFFSSWLPCAEEDRSMVEMMQMCAISSDHNGFVRHVRASMFKSRPCTQASRGLCLDMRYYFPFSEHELSVELCVRSLDHIQALSALICIFYCIFFFSDSMRRISNVPSKSSEKTCAIRQRACRLSLQLVKSPVPMILFVPSQIWRLL